MNARKTIYAMVFFLLVAGLAAAFKGESEHYVVEGIQGLSGAVHGSSEHYEVDLVVGKEPVGYGCSEHYCLCLGYYCGEEGLLEGFLLSFRGLIKSERFLRCCRVGFV